MHKALRDACIQRFEFCVELSWKTSVRAFGLEIKSPNTAIRDMARNTLIDNTQIWFDFLVARNKTSHTYDEEGFYGSTVLFSKYPDAILNSSWASS